ncbi:hypothetical protein DdX_13580 [Ditylenchus destructor]|uniref:Uncharacterized protein n=1 Tax=Ditylenchus destructor TaxID=166010 RepID=A0AAD4MSK3_9BILA|nr:hypothetical protein DdX_13580 [Ditylenchus destructor]
MDRPQQRKDTSWKNFASLEYFDGLEVITLKNVSISDSSLMELSRHRRIRKLTLLDCKFLSTTAIVRAVRNCYNTLRYLEVNNMSLELCEGIFEVLDETRGPQSRPFNGSDSRILLCAPYSIHNLHPWVQWKNPPPFVPTFALEHTNSLRLPYEFEYEIIL